MIEQLDYFKTHRPGTPVPYEIIKKHAYSFDPQDMILKGLTVLYFQVPNHPHDKVKYYAYGAEERDDRACAREEAREDARAKRHKEALDNLTWMNLMLTSRSNTIDNLLGSLVAFPSFHCGLATALNSSDASTLGKSWNVLWIIPRVGHDTVKLRLSRTLLDESENSEICKLMWATAAAVVTTSAARVRIVTEVPITVECKINSVPMLLLWFSFFIHVQSTFPPQINRLALTLLCSVNFSWSSAQLLRDHVGLLK